MRCELGYALVGAVGLDTKEPAFVWLIAFERTQQFFRRRLPGPVEEPFVSTKSTFSLTERAGIRHVVVESREQTAAAALLGSDALRCSVRRAAASDVSKETPDVAVDRPGRGQRLCDRPPLLAQVFEDAQLIRDFVRGATRRISAKDDALFGRSNDPVRVASSSDAADRIDGYSELIEDLARGQHVTTSSYNTNMCSSTEVPVGGAPSGGS
jgi:hypothetical protein